MKALLQERTLVAANILALAVGVGWAAFRLQPGEAGAPSASAPVNGPRRVPVIGRVSTDQVEAKPLFHRSRQPAPAVNAAPDLAATPPQPVPILLGIAGSPGELGALLQDAGGARKHLVHAGQTFGAWTVVEVHSRQVRLREGGKTIELVLRPGRTTTPPQATPGPTQ